MPGWIATATTETGTHYARCTVRRHPAFGRDYESWDTTEDLAEAHVFPDREAAEAHIEFFPAWRVEALPAQSQP